jgi:hypothetical protein
MGFSDFPQAAAVPRLADLFSFFLIRSVRIFRMVWVRGFFPVSSLIIPTMKSIRSFISVLVVSLLPAHADGIPVDHETGKITCDHTVISLTADQIEETQLLGTFTLTPEQWKSLRQKAPSTPKRFETILPVTYDDCCCGLEGPYVIALSKDRVAILHGGRDQVTAEEIRYRLYGEESMVVLRLNERGEFYLDGTLVPYRVLLSALAASPPHAKRNQNGSLVVTVSENGESYQCGRIIVLKLPFGAKRTDAVYATRWKEVENTAKQTGFEVYGE